MAYLLICYDAADAAVLEPIFRAAGARELWPHAMMKIAAQSATEFRESLTFPPRTEANFIVTELPLDGTFLAMRRDSSAREWFGAHWADEYLDRGGTSSGAPD